MKSRPVEVAVVIPFFQREKGILQRAIASILAQDLPPDTVLKIVVVDDQSPVPAWDELASFIVPPPHELCILKQANGGPGSARNRALDALDPKTTAYVAFLDSDDEWLPNHLHTALSVLAEGHDFFFCDHLRYDKQESWFEQCAVMRGWEERTRRPLPVPLSRVDETFSISAQSAFEAFVEEYLSQTSTVVYRFDRHPSLRFDTDLRSAGEDYLFWLTLIRQSRSVAFSGQKNVRCGRGVNIYFSAFDWEHPGAAARNGYLLVFRLKVRQLGLTSGQAVRINAQIVRDGQTYAYLLARNAAKGRMPDWSVLARIFRTSSREALSLPLRLLPMLSKRQRERIAAQQDAGA